VLVLEEEIVWKQFVVSDDVSLLLLVPRRMEIRSWSSLPLNAVGMWVFSMCTGCS
jgi:hypothetical protein